jgi:hypothetical protein
MSESAWWRYRGPVTDDDLKRLVLEFRGAVSEELDSVRSRLDQLVGRFDRMEERADATDAHINGMEHGWLHEIRALGTRLESIERRLPF